MMKLSLLQSLALTAWFCGGSLAAGPDVILGELDAAILFDRGEFSWAAVATTSCNAGTEPLNWLALPGSEHPVIALNLYKLASGRLQQIGQSWLKHGFLALEDDVCGFGCIETFSGGKQLGVGCSDPYGSSLNRGPDLGPRSEVNAVTAVFDGPTANDHSGHSDLDFEHSLEVASTDLTDFGARYFVEGQYLASDDAAAGNGLNNVSHREVRLVQGEGGLMLLNAGPTQRQAPAILAWDGATPFMLDSAEEVVGGRELLARVIVSAKVTQLKGKLFRYEYAVYNMNSDRGIGSLTIPVGDVAISNLGFSAVQSHGEAWSNTPWEVRHADGGLAWSTTPFDADPNANAIRWGTTYNFWFEAEGAPTVGEAVLTKFKPGTVGPDRLEINLPAPSNYPLQPN